jgi:acetyltransferase-like isoleucine patch superfamily enzyme
MIIKTIKSLFCRKSYKKIGKNVKIDKTVRISNENFISIGNNVTINFNTRIEPITLWKGRKYNPQIYIGEGVNIEQCCHITCANEVIIGAGTSLLPFSMITDIKHNFENVNKPSNKQGITVKRTIIGENCSIGTGACILPGVTIGKHCIVGANSVVSKDIPDYSVVVGIPAKIIKKCNMKTGKWENVKSNNLQ